MFYFIAIDIGTTNCKLVVTDEYATIQQTFQLPVTSITDDSGKFEQDPQHVWQLVQTLLQKAIAAYDTDIVAVSFSAAMHSMIAIDKNNHALTNAMIWADTRSKEEAQLLRNDAAGADIYMYTGTPLHAMSPLCKLLWLKKQQPDTFDKAAKFISIKEYIFYRLFGKYIVDEGIASATGLYNIYTKQWHYPALHMAGIKEEQLSVVVPATHIETFVLAEATTLLNLKHNISFVAGGNDGCLANLGCGALDASVAVLTLGTSGAVRLTTPPPAVEKPGGLFRYILTKDLYVCGGPINNGGIVLQWFAQNFMDNVQLEKHQVETLVQQGLQATAGADDLLFLPYLLGERAPVWDEDACGIFYGLKMSHTKTDLMRAVIEGISYSLWQVLEMIQQQQQTEIPAVYVSGFVAHAPSWMQLLANMFNKKIILNDVADASAMGAIFIGMMATNHITGIADTRKFLKADKIFEPDVSKHVLYQRAFEKYKLLYPLTHKLEAFH